MDPERYDRLHELFAATCDLEPKQRATLLDREYAGDPTPLTEDGWHGRRSGSDVARGWTPSHGRACFARSTVPPRCRPKLLADQGLSPI